MLLTGWDAPIVSTLYLDKPLKDEWHYQNNSP
ncbi:hypothetical protein [Endozoicomonas sp. ONNA2]